MATNKSKYSVMLLIIIINLQGERATGLGNGAGIINIAAPKELLSECFSLSEETALRPAVGMWISNSISLN